MSVKHKGEHSGLKLHKPRINISKKKENAAVGFTINHKVDL